MRFLIIANPSAGRGRCAWLLPDIRARLQAAGHEIEFCVSESREDLIRRARDGVQQRVDAVVACGGDGTVHYILQALFEGNPKPERSDGEWADGGMGEGARLEAGDWGLGTGSLPASSPRPPAPNSPLSHSPTLKPRVALGIIPTGRGNDLAQSLGIPADYRKASDVLRQGKTRRLDVANAGGRIYASVAGAGFDAEVTARANQIRGSWIGDRAAWVERRITNHESRITTWLRGQAVYVHAVFRTLARFTPKRLEIEYDGRRFVGEAMLVAVGNTTSYGGGLKIVPQAQPDDGWLDLCIVKKTTKLELLRQLPSVYKGRHVNHPAIEVHRARRVTISSPDPAALFGDGEFLQPLPVTIEIIPQSLQVIVP